MKRLVFLFVFAMMACMVYGQDSTNPQLLRSTKAVAALNTVPYLHMAFEDSTETIAITQDAWYLITNGDTTLWTTQASTRMTAAGDTATVTIAGDYMASLLVNYVATAADTLHIRLLKNNTTAIFPEASEVSIGTEDHVLTFTTLLPNLVVGDDIKPQIMNSNGNDDCEILGGNLVMWLIRYD